MAPPVSIAGWRILDRFRQSEIQYLRFAVRRELEPSSFNVLSFIAFLLDRNS